MTFNWPDIPFNGTEVSTFVDAYKDLGDAIIDQWDEKVDPRELHAPFTNKDTVKELIQAGLVYASFIIQQRAGVAGPGTDFDLGNSPTPIPLDLGERIQFIQDLGCVWDTDEMGDSWEEANRRFPNPPPLNPPEEQDLDRRYPNDPDNPNDNDPHRPDKPDKCPENPCPEGEECINAICVEEECPDNLCSLTTSELRLFAGFALISPFVGLSEMKADLTIRYLTCRSSTFTESNISDGLKSRMKNELTKIIKRKIRYSSIAGQTTIPLTDVTSQVPSNLKSAIGYQTGDKIWKTETYTPNLGSTYALGGVYVIADGTTNEAKRVLDDFDFEYGYEALSQWSPINQSASRFVGMPYTGRKNGAMYQSGCNPDTLLKNLANKVSTGTCGVGDSDWKANIAREVIIKAYKCGRGTPVPVNINLQ